MKRRLIGEEFPVKEVSKESSREKAIRHGHISTLHIWWARRPLASSRTTIYASLIDPPEDPNERKKKSQQIIEMAKWENSLNHNLINRIRQEILDKNNGIPPRVLDPFGGGGSIPLEALRLGCETYSSDVNPVAILIQKCILEFPQKFNAKTDGSLASADKENRLIKDLKKWSDWVCAEAFKDIGKFYPKINDELTVGYITARTVKCQNPKCRVEIPLMHDYWLVRKPGKNIAMHPLVKEKTIQFQIVGDGYVTIPSGFNPKKGTSSDGMAICLACGAVLDPVALKKLFWKKKVYDKQIVTITTKYGIHGKKYRIATKSDLNSYNRAEKYLQIKRKSLLAEFHIDPIPDEIISTPDGKEYQRGGLYWMYALSTLYGMTKWKDLFNTRQILAMIVFTEKIKLAHKLMLSEYDEEYAKAVTTYLAIMLDRLADKNSNLVGYQAGRENIGHVFGRQVLSMIWSYVELNPFSNQGWKNMQNWVIRVIDHCSKSNDTPVQITQESATSLSHDDGYFDAIFTDPPYYDNVPYAGLSDFFYVWLKRSIGHIYPELFSTPLTPKSEEVIENLSLARGNNKSDIQNSVKTIKTKTKFVEILAKSFKEMYRVLKKDGIVVIVYAHKSTEGWETLIDSILRSGLVITGAWPINTEMKSRLAAMEKAALNSSIYMIARKIEKKDLGFYRDVKKELEIHVAKKLDHLWNQDITGADFFISAIGASIEIFGKYSKIVDDDDTPITTANLLEDVRKIATDFAINRVLDTNSEIKISQMTRFYILWRWAYKHAKVPFNDALKLAQSIGIDIEHEYNRGFVKKDKNFITVLEPTDRKIKEMSSSELIDILHKVVLFWKDNNQEDMLSELKKNRIGGSDVLYKVAQAIIESDPSSSESRLLEGFLSNRNKIIEHISSNSKQTKLL